ncbi:MAG: hypothetical protein Q9194_004166 [Teloschistes cf. exilis]
MAFTNTRSAKWSRFWYSASALLSSLVTIAWLVYVYATSSTAKQLSKPIAGNNTTSAGSGGASAAFYLHQAYPCLLNVTVYERENYLGGRSTSVGVYGDAWEQVEVGASIFVDVNYNLVSAVERFNLSTVVYDGEDLDGLTQILGVWNGQKFVFIQNDDGYEWWNNLKLLWKYGLSTIRTQRLADDTMSKFLKMYEAPIFPFKSLGEAATRAGLSASGKTSAQLLKESGIHAPFSSDIIQAATRVNYAQNLAQIHGLEAMVCMVVNGAMSVNGGNWQIFDRMLRHNQNEILLDTRVTDISLLEDRGQYRVKSTSPMSNGLEVSTDTEARNFDTVIIAGPLQFSNISIRPAPAFPPASTPYVTLYVTLFTSPYRLNPSKFGLHSSADVPTAILTTLPEDGGSSASFFSLSILRTVTNTHIQPSRREYLYKLFSPTPPSLKDLIETLNVPARNHTSSSMNDHKSVITWKYDKKWHSYPYLSPRKTFDSPQLDVMGKLWYTSGIEPFISTMETSSLMGKNVAQLIVDDWLLEEAASMAEKAVV